MGKKKKYKIGYLQKQKTKMCFEGEMESYVAKELAKLESEAVQEEKKIEDERKKKIEEIIAFQKHVETIQREPIDFKHDIFAMPSPKAKNKAYKVIFEGYPQYNYIAFTTTQHKAEAEAQRYIRDTYYPTFTVTNCPVGLRDAKARRCTELDEYVMEKQAPISALLKVGLNFVCSACGKVHFNYEDYKTRRCFIVEGEGDIVPFAKGMIFCYSCYNRYFK